MPAESTRRDEVGRQGALGKKGASGGGLLMLLFSATIFISAALLFLVEPMFAKVVLPSFGGTPAVWTGSMMFFQATLLVGYLYVHATTTWLGARRQAILHLVVVLLPLLVLPLAVPGDEWAPSSQSNPIFLLLGLLAVSVGLPFFAISTTNPLVQRWLSDTDHPAARDPYFLYRASNLGSVIGLLGYPLVVEREFTLSNQGLWWSVGYGLLVVLVFASAVMLWRSEPAPAQEEEEAESLSGDPVSGGGSPLTAGPSLEAPAGRLSGRPTWLRRARWVGLTFVPSSLMLGVTAYITTDISPVPLLWVIPLSLYLFSFVIVFSPSQTVPDLVHRGMVAVLPLMIASLVVAMLIDLRDPFWLLVGLHLLGFFVVAMVLHGEVARDRPPARHLTEFYLWVSVGGVLGGVFNALVAPVAFSTVIEYPLAIVLACLFLPGLLLARMVGGERDGRDEARRGGDEERMTSSGSGRGRQLSLVLDIVLPLALGGLMVALGFAVDEGTFDSIFDRPTVWQLFIGLGAGLACLWFAYISSRPIRFGLGIAALIVAVTFANGETSLFEDRSFFGVYRVTGDEQRHTLIFGNTNHGAQAFGTNPPVPTTYYEIDPLIEHIARDESLFTYLRDCPGQKEVVLGDARLSLAEAPDDEYGIIVADAFSSDAIPVHLMTREAIDLYFDKLKENGVLLVHISNRHLELEPVLGNVAQDTGLACRAQTDVEQGPPGKFISHWVMMAREDGDFGSMAENGRWQPCELDPDTAAWTDDFSNLLSTFNWN